MRLNRDLCLAALLAVFCSTVEGRDYVQEMTNLPKSQVQHYLEGLTEAELLTMGEQCYRSGLDDEEVRWTVFADGLLPKWHNQPPASATYLPEIANSQRAAGWRAALVEALSKHAATWDRQAFLEYIDLAHALLQDPEFPEDQKWKLPRSLSAALRDRLKKLGNTANEEFDLLHTRSAAVMRSEAAFLGTHPNGNEPLLRFTVYALGDLAGIYGSSYPASVTLASAKEAREDVIERFRSVISDTNSPPSVVIATLREVCMRKLAGVVTDSEIERIKGSNKFRQNPSALQSLDYWSRKLPTTAQDGPQRAKAQEGQ
jgi:hypothetical protein